MNSSGIQIDNIQNNSIQFTVLCIPCYRYFLYLSTCRIRFIQGRLGES